MPYLHLPVQAGSDRVLKAMNRGHTAEHYLRLVERIRAARPDIALSGDFIVGFPGETRRRLRGDARPGPRGRLRQRLLVQVFAPPRHPGRRHARPGPRRGEGRAAGAAAGAARRAAARVQRRPGRAARCRCCSRSPAAAPGQIAGRSPYLQAVHCEGAGTPDRPDRAGADRRGRPRTASPAALAAGGRLSRGPSEFLPLSEAGVRAVCGPNGRHAALIEDAFHVLLETPGGGVSLNGDGQGARRRQAGAVRPIAAARRRRRSRSPRPTCACAIDHGAGAAPGGGGCRSAGAARSPPRPPPRRATSTCSPRSELVFGAGPGRHRQDLPGGRPRRGPAAVRRGRPAGDHPAGGGGRRAAGLPARRPAARRSIPTWRRSARR